MRLLIVESFSRDVLCFQDQNVGGSAWFSFLFFRRGNRAAPENDRHGASELAMPPGGHPEQPQQQRLVENDIEHENSSLPRSPPRHSQAVASLG